MGFIKDVIKDFVRMIFGLPESQPVSNVQAGLVIGVIAFVLLVLSIIY